MGYQNAYAAVSQLPKAEVDARYSMLDVGYSIPPEADKPKCLIHENKRLLKSGPAIT
jgi:hypothetical protein